MQRRPDAQHRPICHIGWCRFAIVCTVYRHDTAFAAAVYAVFEGPRNAPYLALCDSLQGFDKLYPRLLIGRLGNVGHALAHK